MRIKTTIVIILVILLFTACGTDTVSEKQETNSSAETTQIEKMKEEISSGVVAPIKEDILEAEETSTEIKKPKAKKVLKYHVGNPYFPEDKMAEIDCAGQFDTLDLGIADEEHMKVTCREIEQIGEGVLYQLKITESKLVYEHAPYPENPKYSRVIGTFYVLPDNIYQVENNKKNKKSLRKGIIPEDCPIVCQEEEIKDPLDEDEKGWHAYMTIDYGHRQEEHTYHCYDNSVETGFFETMIWEKNKGLTFYHRGYGAKRDYVCIKQRVYVPDEIQKVIHYNEPFIWSGEWGNGKKTNLGDYNPYEPPKGKKKVDIKRLTSVDLDGDGVEEVLLEYEGSGDILLLHSEEGKVYGYQFPYRGMNDIKEDGTFVSSGGAANWSVCSIKFNQGKYSISNVASMNGHKVKINGKSVSLKKFDKYMDERDKKSNIDSYQFAYYSENVLTKGEIK